MVCRKNLKQLLKVTFGSLILIGCASAPPSTPENIQHYTVKNINDYSVSRLASCPLNNKQTDLLLGVKNGTITSKFQPNLTSKRQLTDSEAREWLRIFKTPIPPKAPAINLPDHKKKIFFAIFDGTYNDRDDKSLPLTVPAELSLLLEELSKKRSDIEVKYYNGVGTRVNWFQKLYEGITGRGSVSRAEIAFDDLINYSDDMSDKPNVYAIGFSRGAASARHFLNMANEYLLQNENNSDHFLGLGKSRSYALLFDTVATGQFNNLNLRIGENTISVLHLISKGERRVAFPVTSVITDDLDKFDRERIIEISLPGVHSDIGGGYGKGLETLSLNFAIDWLTVQGIALKKEEVDPRAITNMGKNDSDWFLTPFVNFLKTRLYSDERTIIYPNPKKTLDEKLVNNQSIEAVERYTKFLEFKTNVFIDYGARIAEGLNKHRELMNKRKKDEEKSSSILSVLLRIKDDKLYIQTNCPENVGFDLKTNFILLNGHDFEKIDTNLMKDLIDNPYGVLQMYYSEDAKNFEAKNVES